MDESDVVQKSFLSVNFFYESEGPSMYEAAGVNQKKL